MLVKPLRDKIFISTHAPAGGATFYTGYDSICIRRFLLTPLREGRRGTISLAVKYIKRFLLTPLREGRRGLRIARKGLSHFYSRPCGRGDAYARAAGRYDAHFYSRPCGRGDITAANMAAILARISTHAPAGGATSPPMICAAWHSQFLLTPLREGRPECVMRLPACIVFLLTPLREGRPARLAAIGQRPLFLLTPLREGRLVIQHSDIALVAISTHAPAGGATKYAMERGGWSSDKFLLTPLREGRLHKERFQKLRIRFLLTPLREGRRVVCSFF